MAGSPIKRARRAAMAAMQDAPDDVRPEKGLSQKRPRGRPSKKTPELCAEICERLSRDESEYSICADEHMPSRATLREWRLQDPDFQAECARAREQQADYLFGEMAEIEGRVLSGALDSQAAKVVLSSRQWRASKLAPRTYGDRQVIAGDPDAPLLGGLAESILAARARAGRGGSGGEDLQ